MDQKQKEIVDKEIELYKKERMLEVDEEILQIKEHVLMSINNLRSYVRDKIENRKTNCG